MKKAFLLISLFLPCFMYAEDKSLALGLGNANFFLDTNIMEDGTISNVGFGLSYNDSWGGEIRGRAAITSKNEELEDSSVADSLIATKETIYELYLLPAQYRPAVNQSFKWWIGAGLYYEYQKSIQKGYIDMPDLAALGLAQVNSYSDDFSVHIFGPLIDAEVTYASEWFSISFSGGIVPIFSLTAAEKQRMYPLFDTVNHSQNTWGAPYFYLGLDSILFKYVNVALKYNYARLKYDVIDLDYNATANKFTPIFPESTVVSQSLMFEISALIPLGGMSFQIGYGYMSNFYTRDAGDPVSENKHYLILSGKKLSL